MNQPAPAPAREPDLTADAHRPIREAIARLRPGGSSIDDIKAAIADVLYRDLHQAGELRALLDEAHRDRSLGMDDYRRLSAELHRLVTEEVPTDGIPDAPPRTAERKPALRKSPIGAGTLLARRYQLEERVAEGPLSDVYRAGDRWRAELAAGNASVAIKLLAPAADGFVDRDKLRRQALLAQHLAHPNICQVLGVDRDGDTDFVVTEWLEGESLAGLMDRCHPAPLDTARVRAVCEATAAALEHALDHDLVHGDLKPANVFVCNDGSIKLLDFGLARGESAAPAMTPEYASCEILEGRAPEPADDIYAFAVMVYRAMTGSRPFGRRSALEAEADGARAERVPELDDEQWAALERALSFRRSDREIGAVRLAATLARSPGIPRVQNEHPPEPSRDWRPFAAILVVGAVIAGLVTGVPERAAEWWRNQDRPAPVVVSPVAKPPVAETPVAETPVQALPAAEPVERAETLSEDAPPVVVEPAPVDSLARDAGSAAPAEPLVVVEPAATTTEPPPEPVAEAPEQPAPEIETAAVTPPAPVRGGRLGFREARYEADESDGFVKLRLRAPAGHPGIRLRLRAGAGSAEFGTDYALAEQIIEIEPGRTRSEVLWPLVDDGRDEYLEEVELLLESLTDDYPATRADALVIIFDDDGPQAVDSAEPALP